MELRDVHAVVTGASKGIGAEIARALAHRGAHVTGIARSEDLLKELAHEIGGTAVAVDLSDPDHHDGLIARIEGTVGRPVDVLVNNAAVSFAGKFATQDAAGTRATVTLNFLAPVELCRQVLPGMLERGRGAVANVSSLGGIIAVPGVVTYGATKGGLSHFTAALRRELRRSPVRVMVVHLGEVAETEMMRSADLEPIVHAISRRFRRSGVLPDLTPAYVGGQIVDAISSGRRELVVPRRAAVFHHLHELPTRINNLLLTGID